MLATGSVIAQRKHCELNIIDQLPSCPQIKYVMPLTELQLSPHYFILNSTQALYQAERLRSLFPQEIESLIQSSDCVSVSGGVSTINIARAKKALSLLFLPLLFPFLSKERQNRWNHHLCFFQLVRLDLLMKWSLYAMLHMQMCSCTFFNVATVKNCPAVRVISSTA